MILWILQKNVVTIDKFSILLISEVIYQQFDLARNQKKKEELIQQQ